MWHLHIFVQEGRKGVSKIAREENEKLDSIVGVSSNRALRVRQRCWAPRYQGRAIRLWFRFVELREGYMESASVMIHVRFAPNGTVIEISERRRL